MFRSFFNSTLGIVLAIPVAHADEPVWFFDHFTDGNIHDDAPTSWYTGGYGETLDVVDGDLQLIPRPEVAAAIVDEAGYQNVSLLTRMGVSSRGFTDAGLLARRDGAVAYTAGISGNRFGQYDHSLVLTYGGLSHTNFEVLASIPTDLDPSISDVLLQFDVVDDLLRLFAWADGTPRPAQPQVLAQDDRLRQGSIGMFIDGDSTDVRAVFREFLALPGAFSHPATASVRFDNIGFVVPEPSTAGLLLIGTCAAATFLRNGRICLANRCLNRKLTA